MLKINKISLIIFILMLILVFLLSSRMIISGNFFLLADQGRDFSLTKSIVVDHKLTLIGTHSGLGGIFHGPLWLYLLAPVFILGHGDPIYFAYFYILIAEITVISAFIVGKKLYGEKIALIFAFLVGTSPVIGSYVPNTIGVNLMPLLYIFVVYFLILYIRGNNKSFIFLSFLTGLAFQFETASAIALVPIIFFTYFYHFKNVKNFKLIFLSLFAFGLSIANFIFFDLRHQFIISKSIINTFSINSVHAKGYLDLSHRFFDHLTSLIGIYRGPFLPQSQYFYIFILVYIILGLILIISKNFKDKNKYPVEIFYLILFPALNFIIYMFYPYTIWPEYTLGFLSPLAMGYSLIIYLNIKNKLMLLLTIILVIFYCSNIFILIKNQYFTKVDYSYNGGTYLNQERVVTFIFNDAKKSNFGYFVYSPDTFTYSMDYLFWWNGEKYGYLPKNEKLRNTYLVMSPPLAGDNNAYNFWKKYVIRTTAPLVWQKVFPGNITVQKLLIVKPEKNVDPNYFQDLIFR